MKCKICGSEQGFNIVKQGKQNLLTCKHCGVTKSQQEYKDLTPSEINSLREVLTRQEKTRSVVNSMSEHEQDERVRLKQKELDLLRRINGG